MDLLTPVKQARCHLYGEGKEPGKPLIEKSLPLASKGAAGLFSEP
jgi:hypothetical protein